jgi:CRP-like cAMP-binding protein
MMEQIRQVMKQMIRVSEEELNVFLGKAYVKSFKRNEKVSDVDVIPNEIYFINKGLIRVLIIDSEGNEHTIHFALENQFIADYSSYMLKQPSMYHLQTVEETEVVVLPRAAIDWGYSNLIEGQKMGRLIAEFYFIYQDDRIKNMYSRTAKQRYDSISDVFPNIHKRVPQHMIASYLGISPVHLSRLKKAENMKV